DADRKSPAIVSRAHIPRVRRVAQQAWMIRTTRQSACPRIRVTVIRRYPQTSKFSRQEGQVLQVRCFESGDPRTSRVDRLRHSVWTHRRYGRRLEVIQDERVGDDRIRQALVEKSSRDHSKRIQVVFHQYIEIVRGLCLQVRISQRGRVLERTWASRGRKGHR